MNTPMDEREAAELVRALIEKWEAQSIALDGPGRHYTTLDRCADDLRQVLAKINERLLRRDAPREGGEAHHWIGGGLLREHQRVETRTGKIVARIRRDTLSNECAWGQSWYIDEASACAAVEQKYPDAPTRPQLVGEVLRADDAGKGLASRAFTDEGDAAATRITGDGS